jgi:hypothetical protein
VTYEIPRLRGEMVSMTGVTDQASNPAFAQTALGVQGRIGENWQLGIRGKLQRFEDTSDDAVFGEPLAQSRAMSMELRSSPTEVYRVASTMSSWQYAKDIEPGDRQVDVRAHDFEWEHGAARVQVHYFAQANLFRSTPGGSDRIEIAGDTTLLQTRRSDLGVALRVTQESLHSGGERLRSADVAANASYELHPSLVMHYGMAGRFGIESRELAPHTGAEWKVTKNTSVVGSAMVKVMNQRDAMFLPRTMIWTDDEHMLPRYAYSFGVVSGSDGNNRVSAIVTYTLVDTPMRVLFADGTERFWDGMQVDSGDARRDIRLAYRREFGRNFAVDVSTTAGKARARTAILPAREKFYVAGDLQSTFTPTRTSLAVSYREIQQPADTSGAGTDYVSERVNLRMAQSLYLPIDVKILLGLELARAENSPFLLDTGLAVGASRRYIGGVALNF